MALGIILPALPKLVAQMSGGTTVSAVMLYGLFGSAFGLMQFIGSPVLGALSDRFGRRPLILLSNIGLGVDYILMALAPNLWLLFIGRLIGGLTAASVPVATAYIADVTPEHERAGEFGKIGAVFGLGFILGPAIGGVLTGIDPRLPFAFAATLSLLNGAYCYFLLPESLPPNRRMAFSWARANPMGSLRLLRTNKALSALAVIYFLDAMAMMSLPSTFVLYASYRYGWSEMTVGFTFAAVGLAIAIVSGFLTKPIVARIGEHRALIAGLLVGAMGFASYGATPVGYGIWLAIPLLALWGIAGAASDSLMSARVANNEQGQLQGANASLGALAETIGPILFSQIFAFAIAPATDVGLPGLPFFLASAFMLVASVVAVKIALRES